jgi:signal transduction histidine kinase
VIIMNLTKGARLSSGNKGSLGRLCFASGNEDVLGTDRGGRSHNSHIGLERTRKSDVNGDPSDARVNSSPRPEVLVELVDSLAHDFNNLLTIIMVNLERSLDRSLDPELQRHLTTTYDAAKRGERLVQSLLSSARRKPGARDPLDLNGLIRNMEALLVHCLGPRIKLMMRLDPDACPVDADASQAEMAILNLAVNARDAMPQGGVLRIETAGRTLSGEYDGLQGGFVALTVADTGCGMAPEVLARAFEPHFTTKSKGRGMGLGLATVRRLAKRVDGTVSIESAPGTGTAVTVYLPRSRTPGDTGLKAHG